MKKSHFIAGIALATAVAPGGATGLQVPSKLTATSEFVKPTYGLDEPIIVFERQPSPVIGGWNYEYSGVYLSGYGAYMNENGQGWRVENIPGGTTVTISGVRNGYGGTFDIYVNGTLLGSGSCDAPYNQLGTYYPPFKLPAGRKHQVLIRCTSKFLFLDEIALT